MSSVREFGARGDGKADDTAALQHAIQKGDGQLVFPPGEYRITRTLMVPLDRVGPLAVGGSAGTARVVMSAAGPAFHVAGTHRRTAQPDHFLPGVWAKERMPTVSDLEIVGDHPDADGVRVEGAMQLTLRGLLIRRCRHGVHLLNRDRNVIVSDCHIYDNRGVGIFLDAVNLHQTNIHGNHISYCKRGGVVVSGGEVRNIQICSNDIEYNFDPKAETSADVLFDARKGTIREGTIVGNTIQALRSPGGANVRLLGVGKDNPNAVGMISVTGNLIGSQSAALHLSACRGVVVSGNSIYCGYDYALVAEDCEQLVFASNCVDHNPDYKGKSTDALLLSGCRNVTLTGLQVQHAHESEMEPPATLELRDCQAVSVTGSQIAAARTRGIYVRGGSVVRVADCTVRGRKGDASYRAAVEVEGATQTMVVNCFLGKGTKGDLLMPKDAGTAGGNVTLGE